MSLTPANVIIGACTISATGGSTSGDLGLTTEDGVTFGEITREYYDVWSDRSLVVVKKVLVKIARSITFNLQEVTIAAMKDYFGASVLTSGSKITFAQAVTELILTITGPCAAGSTFTYVTSCWSISCGDVVRSKSSEAILPVTVEEVGAPAYNTFGTYTEG